MSHQTGIQANEKLRQFISECKISGKARVLKVSISNEELILDEYKEPIGKWDEDYNQFVNRLVLNKQPCYLLFRLDSVNSSNLFEWILICWSPDDSPVRQKMLYASTKATLKSTFGSASIVDDYLATNEDEISLSVYQRVAKTNRNEQDGPSSLLTAKEQDLQAVKRDEALSSISQSRCLPGLQFPLTDAAVDALLELKEAKIAYLQLSIDLTKEEITLETKETNAQFDINDLPKKVPTTNARYHLLVYPHTHEEKLFNSVVFIYTIPRSGCPVKERMLYSSCRNALVTAIQDETRFGIAIDKRLESDDPEELTKAYILDELHPKENVEKNKFEKPKGPAGKRGAKRLIKTSDEV
ncbi:twinfilin-2-like isoform X3 [Leptotrombidium deliense]|uniref:Twinfilin n=1 Tax=Leptotrombidium deliense TaxID=299467 RepID=A0A443SQD9_9ACAR|nr:twinfilin-2-like isoform X3 [Leptotrombidium deliense]